MPEPNYAGGEPLGFWGCFVGFLVLFVGFLLVQGC
jgi:hypothetical protein